MLVVGLHRLGGRDKRLSLGYVTWESEIASHAVLAAVLEDYLGYDVEHITLDAGPMWTGIAQGEFDITIAAWLPGTHEHYYEQLWTTGRKPWSRAARCQDRLGRPVVRHHRQHRRVEQRAQPTSADASSASTRVRALCPPPNEAIDEYGLDFTLVDGSDAAMTAALRTAIRRNQWVVVTGWTPHWKFAEWDLKYLEDPWVSSAVRNRSTRSSRTGFHEDAPEAYSSCSGFTGRRSRWPK